MGTTMNITKTDGFEAPRHPRRLIDAFPSSTPRRLFAAALLERRWSHLATDEFAVATPLEDLAELGELVVVRSDRAGDEVEALVLLPQGGAALIDARHGDVGVEVAGPTRELVDDAVATIRAALACTTLVELHTRQRPARANRRRSPCRGCGAFTATRDEPAISRAPRAREYDELRLRIGPIRDNTYRVHASTSWAEVNGDFAVPFDEFALENFMVLASQSSRRVDSDASAMREAKRFGGTLFRALFRDETYGVYREALADARSRSRGLRIKLCLTEAPELIDIPWEFLFDAPDFLAMSSPTLVVRYLDLPRRSRPLAVAPPLRILGVTSSPADYERLDVERERADLEGALSDLIASGVIELHWIEAATVDLLLRTLRRDTFHALHYIGHGRHDRRTDRGLLLFEDQSGWGTPVTGEQLGTVLREFESLRLTVLNACDGGRCGETDPFAGVAESLVQREIPAVIAMQREISDDAAILFAEGFYSAIAAGAPVDAAVAAARLAMFARGGDGLEWGMPVLYMRVTDGRIFALPDEQPAAVTGVGW
jgi:hypothetical protein